jgi:hypothetical protein
VKQGKYNLSALLPDGSGVYWLNRETNNIYTIVVGPVCPLDLGQYSYA